jgi:hypothetical protein
LFLLFNIHQIRSQKLFRFVTGGTSLWFQNKIFTYVNRVDVEIRVDTFDITKIANYKHIVKLVDDFAYLSKFLALAFGRNILGKCFFGVVAYKKISL